MAKTHRIAAAIVTLVVVTSLAASGPALAGGKNKGSPQSGGFHFVHLYDKASPVLH